MNYSYGNRFVSPNVKNLYHFADYILLSSIALKQKAGAIAWALITYMEI
jgi:hypothetical protein